MSVCYHQQGINEILMFTVRIVTRKHIRLDNIWFGFQAHLTWLRAVAFYTTWPTLRYKKNLKSDSDPAARTIVKFSIVTSCFFTQWNNISLFIIMKQRRFFLQIGLNAISQSLSETGGMALMVYGRYTLYIYTYFYLRHY
jgi:hypothetical protein